MGGTAAVTVNAAVPVITVTTKAWIGASAVITAGGNVIVAASDDFTLFTIAGNISVAGTAAVGAGVAVPVVTKTTQSWIGDGARVTGRALAGHMTHTTVASGPFDTNGTDTRFDPRATLGGYPTPYPASPSTAAGLQAGGAPSTSAISTASSPASKSCTTPAAVRRSPGSPTAGPTSSSRSRHRDPAVPKRGPPLSPGSDEFSCEPGSASPGSRLPGGAKSWARTTGSCPPPSPGVASDVSPRFTAELAVGATGTISCSRTSCTRTMARPRALKNGDPVVYSAGGGTPIGGLVDGATYYFFTGNNGLDP